MLGKCCHQCSALPARGKPLRACTGCKEVFYCNQSCQKQDWATHKSACRRLPLTPGTKTPDLTQCRASAPLTLGLRVADAPLTAAQATRPLILQPLLMTTIPPKYEDPAECVSGGYTACAIPAGMKAALLTQPGFPHAVPVPSTPAHRIAAVAGAGLGLLTTRDIATGELMLAERALVIASLSGWCMMRTLNYDNESCVEQLAHAHADKEAVLKALMKSLPHEKRAAYRALTNAHKHDGHGPLWGVMCTNMFGIEKKKLKALVPDIPDDEKILHFGAVCETLSRLNHSCCPNASVHFDPPSFSFKLQAVRPIPAGAEITVTYICLIAPTATRQAQLAHFGFTCTCAACSDPHASDKHRAELKATPCRAPTEMFAWLLRSGCRMPADFLTRPSARVLALAEEEGVQVADVYTMHLEQLCIAYGTLGQREEYLRARAQFMLLRQGVPEAGYKDMMPADPEMHPFWGLRARGGTRNIHHLNSMVLSDPVAGK